MRQKAASSLTLQQCRNKYFFPCKTKHWPYVTLANFPIKDPAHAGIFLSHTTHLKMTTVSYTHR
ncbi:hypothetical protein, partial [Acinetobacter baumannii]|uniref:hypothetical protein n=1 Tax=Acinetobacter baumannii TaxID=470 RepID=UPI00105A4BBD